MPSVSDRQRRFMGAELGRARAGKPTQTGMSQAKLKDFAKGPVKKANPGPPKHRPKLRAAPGLPRLEPNAPVAPNKPARFPGFNPELAVKRPNPLGRY